ncbi:hypothetical protein CEP54_010073 [Fusarium duplospermum]|uniref:Uncharacterized protein n=1 Tax=Fusarium duplospermum TaxID=1325734 RepID=A0A428PM87_9HYPO|nr:hypothetical protein CEP54_010073 [Fusarium duplospermum]
MSEPAADEYTIGWICALQEEFEAACRMLDNEFDSLDAADPKDDNTYVFGRIHQHNIVIGCLPSGIYGTTSAAYVARDMVRSFPSLRFALMVGIGGGAPTPERDIRLGDVVVSEPKGEIGGVVQYDLGKRMSDGVMKRTGQLNAPPRVLLSAFPEVRRRHNDPRKSHFMVENMARMDDMPNYSRPAADKLYHTSSRHQGHKACEGCDPKGVVERSTRPSERAIAIHYGTIASGNTVMKDAAERDRYANDPALNVLCFEMEAAGLMNDFPCLVIRGICDYSDDHKNDEWHNYAALTAAAYARDLLGVVRPQKVASQPAWTGKIATVLSEINQGVKKVVHHQGMKDDEDLLRWLSPIDHAKTQMDKARGPSPGTKAGQWLLDSPEFHDWLNTGKKTLFCPGIPGAGKTVLVSTLVNYLLGRQEHGDGNQARRIGVAFIYLDFKQPFELVHFVGSILRQLAANDPSALDSIHQLHNRCHNGLREPSLSEIREILHSIVPGFSRLFIIVDALDEGEQQLCHGLLSEIFDLQRDHGVNVFATSRHIPNIEKRFSGDRLLEIRASDEDVRNYVDSYMAKLPGFVSRSPELQEEARSGIVKAVDGMFLLARFHLDSLIGTRSVRAFREAIECLPTGKQACDYAYDLALERIEGQVQNKRALAIEVLSWVVCAKYHLTTLQLQHALAVIPGSPHFDASNIPEIEDIVSVCAGLVVVDRERDIVRLVHHTAQEYFDRSQKQRLPDAQSYITNVCLTYLSLDSFQEEAWLKNKLLRDRVRGMPFYSYAAMNWGYHAHESALLPPAVLEFLKCPRKIGGSGIIGLHLASYFGIVEAVRLLADQSCINWKDRYGRTPLSWAICNGQVEVVAYLLGTGLVDSEPRDSRSRTPLHLAAEKGHPDSMILLLMGGDVNVNTCDDEGDTPLHLAVEEGHEAVVKILLDYGADLNIYNKAEVRPLTRAAIIWATQIDVDVISMSWTFHERTETGEQKTGLMDAIQKAYNKGIILSSSLNDKEVTLVRNWLLVKLTEVIRVGSATKWGDKTDFSKRESANYLFPGQDLVFRLSRLQL